jgi:glycosyltransferase involved in cell wall biosynthesis
MNHSAAADWHKLSVVRLGIVPGDHSAAATTSRADRFTLLCVGRLTPAKGQHLLVEAMRRIAASGRDDIDLVLAGDGPDADSLRSAAERHGLGPRIRFTGALNRDEVRALYTAADAFVLPSFAEGIPIVLMEAMASGVPCLTTRIAGIPELIEDGRDGLLVPASDIDALVDRITALADDATLRHRLAEAGRRRVTAEYDLERNIGRLAELFRNRLAGVPA